MNIISLSLHRSATDKRPSTCIYVNFDRVQCLEPHGEGTRIQFHLNEPSLYVRESVETILLKL